jgi:hypothetical protein
VSPAPGALKRANHRQVPACRIGYWLVIIAMTLAACQAYLAGLEWEEPRLALSQLMDGTAHRPFVFRVLVPFLVTRAIDLFPLPPTLYASLLIYVSLLGSVITIRSLSALYWNSVAILDAIGALSIIMLFPLMLTNRHVYDFSTLFLFSLGLKLMAQAKWEPFFLVYAISCLNKETTVLLSLAFAACFWHRVRDTLFWKLLLGQMAIYTAFRLTILWRFRDNPGGVVENHLAEHFAVFGIAPIFVSTCTGLGLLIVVLALRDWKKKPFFLRRAALGVVPAMSVLYVLWGSPLEIRVFYEAYPLVFLLVLPTAGPMLGLQFEAVQDPHAADSRSVTLHAGGSGID